MVLKILDQIDPEYFNATTALGIYPEHLRSDKFDVRRTVCKFEKRFFLSLVKIANTLISVYDI